MRFGHETHNYVKKIKCSILDVSNDFSFKGLSFTMILSHSTYKTYMHLKSVREKQRKGDGEALMNLIWTFF